MKYLILFLLPCLAWAQSVETGTATTFVNVDRGGVDWVDQAANVDNGIQSNWFVASGFGLAVDGEAVIDSLSVSITTDYADFPPDIGAISLFSSDVPVGSTLIANTPWEGILTLSGDATYWGTDLNPTLINSLAIGAWIYSDAPNPGIFNSASVTVYYHVPAGPARGGVYAAVGQASLVNRAYNASTLDTTKAIALRGKLNNYLTLASKDSASLTIKYQLSLDGVNWGVLTTVDSLSTASDVGDARSISMDNVALGAPFVRFVFSQNPAFRFGRTSATYTARVVQR